MDIIKLYLIWINRLIYLDFSSFASDLAINFMEELLEFLWFLNFGLVPLDSIEFHRVLLFGSINCGHVQLDSIGFHLGVPLAVVVFRWISLDSIGFPYLGSIFGFNHGFLNWRTPIISIQSHWFPPGSTWVIWVLFGFSGFHCVPMDSIGFYWYLLDRLEFIKFG